MGMATNGSFLVARSELRTRTAPLLESIALRRSHRIAVSGLTTVIAFRIEGENRYRQTKISQSMFRSRTRRRPQSHTRGSVAQAREACCACSIVISDSP